MREIELEFVKKRLSEGYVSLLESDQYNMALTLYRSEKMLFKHALNLTMHYFVNNNTAYDDFNGMIPYTLPYIMDSVTYIGGDMKMVLEYDYSLAMENHLPYELKLYVNDSLVLEYTEIMESDLEIQEYPAMFAKVIAKNHWTEIKNNLNL